MRKEEEEEEEDEGEKEEEEESKEDKEEEAASFLQFLSGEDEAAEEDEVEGAEAAEEDEEEGAEIDNEREDDDNEDCNRKPSAALTADRKPAPASAANSDESHGFISEAEADDTLRPIILNSDMDAEAVNTEPTLNAEPTLASTFDSKPTFASAFDSKPTLASKNVSASVFVTDPDKKPDLDDSRLISWQKTKPGEKYFHCHWCDYVKLISEKTEGYDEIPVDKRPDGRLPIEQTKPKEVLRKLPQWTKMRAHLRKCVVKRKISRSEDLLRQYNKEGVAYLDTFFAPALQQKKVKYDQTKTKLPNGEINHPFYREARREADMKIVEAKAYKRAMNDILQRQKENEARRSAMAS